MRKNYVVLSVFVVFFFAACSSSKNYEASNTSLKEELDQKNRGAISLLNQIRQKPGVVLKNGVPFLQKSNISFSTNGGSQEPLYVLDDLIVGNSFASLNDLVDNFMVKKIEVLTGPDAAYYGSRASLGVIKISTHK